MLLGQNSHHNDVLSLCFVTISWHPIQLWSNTWSWLYLWKIKRWVTLSQPYLLDNEDDDGTHTKMMPFLIATLLVTPPTDVKLYGFWSQPCLYNIKVWQPFISPPQKAQWWWEQHRIIMSWQTTCILENMLTKCLMQTCLIIYVIKFRTIHRQTHTTSIHTHTLHTDSHTTHMHTYTTHLLHTHYTPHVIALFVSRSTIGILQPFQYSVCIFIMSQKQTKTPTHSKGK